MVYLTICSECLNGDCSNCGKSLEPELKEIREYNKNNPQDFMCGGGHCICGHGEPESKLQQSVREKC